MPQNRRKVPFSGKKKKEQIAQKRNFKSSQRHFKGTSDDGETTEDTEYTARKLMEQPMNRASSSNAAYGARRNFNRYNLQFHQESKKELEEMKIESYKPFCKLTPNDYEMDEHHFAGFDFPIRPDWSINIDKDTLDLNENRYFREYVENLQKLHKNENKELSLFELNLETWRQLWRVLEFSDILLIVVDVRYATLMFPPALYSYIVQTLKKHAILVLNKVDLVTPEVVVAWQHYFKEQYPNLPVVLFASYPTKTVKGVNRGRFGYKRSMEGVYNIFRACEKIVNCELDLTTWEQKILEDMNIDSIIDDEPTVSEESPAQKAYNDNKPYEKYYKGILTIGCIGFPNVGKSSLINALKGHKVVSVSHTPGHTKHFQTIFLTNIVRLCDCPGLVFPSSTPKHLQVLLGSYPISQLQVPYRALKYLSEHINLPHLLKLHLPEDFDVWSAAALSDAWALKRGFLTARSARPDRYRAANHLLRMCLAGQNNIILYFYPPDYEKKKEFWQSHADVEGVKKYQNMQNEDDVEKHNAEESLTANSESESDEISSSNDETNADEDDEEKQNTTTAIKQSNAFSMLQDMD